MEAYREPGGACNQNIQSVNEFESSRVRTKLPEGSAQQKKGKIMVHFSVWLAETFQVWVTQAGFCFPVSRHGQASESSFLSYWSPPYNSINSRSSPPPVTVFFLALWVYRGITPFRKKRLMGLANSQEVMGRGQGFFQCGFKAVMKCGVEIFRNPWPLGYSTLLLFFICWL